MATYRENKHSRLNKNPWLRTDAYITAALSVLVLLGGVFANRFASERKPIELFENFRLWIMAAAVFLFISAACQFYKTRHIQRNVAIAGLCSLLGIQMLGWGFQEIAVSRSSRDIADAIFRNRLSDSNVYSVEDYPQSLPFYLNKTITIAEYKGELEMGIDAEPGEWLENADEFIDRWNNEEQAVEGILSRIGRQGLEFTEIETVLFNIDRTTSSSNICVSTIG